MQQGNGSSASASPSAPADRADQLVAFTRCMRENGIDMPDPAPGEENIQLPAGTKGDAGTQKALATCQRHLGSGTGAKDVTDGAVHDRAVELAKCLREKGVNVADPKPGEPLQLTGGGNDPKVRAAITECRAARGANTSPSGE
ncbi:hypothetical protein [Streptomyces clavuligerus]|uniref:hypothetical protein n=1 Tax=Streptomyces clavuligerus TaxID=1901 RepID=UPI0002D72269|nr:hypothetical protein [Streptomyces clavuligerus]WDN57203.1 hypothetical protein LL058_36085 [Streptomyces clavuligerus]